VIQRPSSPLRSLLPWIVAASFALAAAWFGRLYLVANLESEQLRIQFALAELALKSGDQQLQAERIVARAQLAQLELANFQIAPLRALQNDAAETRAVVVWNPAKHEGVFMAEKMPALPPDEKWELWLFERGEAAKPVSAGAFASRDGEVTRINFKPSASVDAVAKFAVSREKNDEPRSRVAPTKLILSGDAR
jgi:hypothetical protein